ncbi:pyrimidine dimer DNA glycosylase/endonuclease V [Halobacteria archaeon AArc-dxtr1]|nr:pyrimidine dimer DNA glycosylase/endonuclease V [Halobacteria archaeon AArc-dxtr1]
MTRLWGVDPALLCDQHLLGEHSEMHQEVGTLLNHPHGEAIVRGHAERNQVDTSLLQSRHDELAVELERRGMNHESPLAYDDDHELGSIDVERNLSELAQRCVDCRARIEAREGETTTEDD